MQTSQILPRTPFSYFLSYYCQLKLFPLMHLLCQLYLCNAFVRVVSVWQWEAKTVLLHVYIDCFTSITSIETLSQSDASRFSRQGCQTQRQAIVWHASLIAPPIITAYSQSTSPQYIQTAFLLLSSGCNCTKRFTNFVKVKQFDYFRIGSSGGREMFPASSNWVTRDSSNYIPIGYM
jgi:hypothetical protein